MRRLTRSVIAFVLCAALLSFAACEVMTAAKSDGVDGIGESAAENIAESADASASYDDPDINEQQGISGKTIDLMAGFTPSGAVSVAVGEAFTKAYNSFATKLFKKLYCGDNELISPLSVELALAMTTNGAKNDTLTQMQNVLFDGADIKDFNAYFKAYVSSFAGAKYPKLKTANSIWFKDHPSLTVSDAFLQTNADYYGAGAYKAPFDNGTLNDINGWVKENTEGMIEKILDRISAYAVMYLVNTVYFEADWVNEFNPSYKDTFTKESGEELTIDMMGCELYSYLENDFATGFRKAYKGNRFVFAAMLPKEGVSMATAVESLSEETLKDFFDSNKSERTRVKMPKFKLDYDVEMGEYLAALGMTDAFDMALADFSGMATYSGANIYIGHVIHKTAIEVNEYGTKAAAATVVEPRAGSAGPTQDEPHYVYLDRPFLYFLLDTETDTPLFMGAYNG
ncbi:MAG: serpin family protein [Clostridia bacterium]|nr:serpin family protein [Clostridia bacterium]